MSAVDEILVMMSAADPFDYDPRGIRKLQLQAATERLGIARSRMKVLENRASSAGVDEVTDLEQVIPLFFSDSTYKGYPEELLTKGQWTVLARWLDAVSVDQGAASVEFAGVSNIDDWLERLREAGHTVHVSSGTSGRCSIFKSSPQDCEFDRDLQRLLWRWSTGAEADGTRPVFSFFPIEGHHRMMDSFGQVARAFGTPEHTTYLSQDPLRVSDVNATARLRRDVAAGTAAPSEIVAFNQMQEAGLARMRDNLQRMADAIVTYQDQPSMLLGTWAPLFRTVEILESTPGFTGMHPDSVILAAGGLKGIVLPEAYEQRIRTTLGVDKSRYMTLYGMSEVISLCSGCEQGRYHVPPTMIPIILDKSGDALAEADGDGTYRGRVAFFDLALSGRWGALISGDRGELSHERCLCGRAGSTFADTIIRYIDLPEGDEKVSCAGTVDAYVQGLIGG